MTNLASAWRIWATVLAISLLLAGARPLWSETIAKLNADAAATASTVGSITSRPRASTAGGTAAGAVAGEVVGAGPRGAGSFAAMMTIATVAITAAATVKNLPMVWLLRPAWFPPAAGGIMRAW